VLCHGGKLKEGGRWSSEGERKNEREREQDNYLMIMMLAHDKFLHPVMKAECND
jgi:hypothetical protein